MFAGSSPHVRGALVRYECFEHVRGIIPACAGSTRRCVQPLDACRDHPRMCGEHRIAMNREKFTQGSSPHVRGALSRPRGHVSGYWDHPRMCGEHLDAGSEQKPCPGSSPHVRGALRNVRDSNPRTGIIPACAGSTNGYDSARLNLGDHPRMCGEHKYGLPVRLPVPGSSPHVRGAPATSVLALSHLGIIPACAGSTRLAVPSGCRMRDHPRMCGEH